MQREKGRETERKRVRLVEVTHWMLHTRTHTKIVRRLSPRRPVLPIQCEARSPTTPASHPPYTHTARSWKYVCYRLPHSLQDGTAEKYRFFWNSFHVNIVLWYHCQSYCLSFLSFHFYSKLKFNSFCRWKMEKTKIAKELIKQID